MTQTARPLPKLSSPEIKRRIKSDTLFDIMSWLAPAIAEWASTTVRHPKAIGMSIAGATLAGLANALEEGRKITVDDLRHTAQKLKQASKRGGA